MKTIGKIRNLAMLGLLALAGTSSGCIIESSSPPPPPPPACLDGAVFASWTLFSQGQQVECAPGDEVDLNVGPTQTTFDCFAHQGTSVSVPGGVSYPVSLGLFSAANAPLSTTQTMSLFVHCDTTEDILDVPFDL